VETSQGVASVKLSDVNPSAFLLCYGSNFHKFVKEQGIAPDWSNAEELGITWEAVPRRKNKKGGVVSRSPGQFDIVIRVKGQEKHRIGLKLLLALATRKP
jgi:hypothetical protein